MTCQVIRIGVFFDGTGNNLFNDEAGRSKNGVSNIGKLEVFQKVCSLKCQDLIFQISQ